MGRFGTKKSDVYSLGIILWEIASGKKAFADKVCSKIEKLNYQSD